MTLSHVTFTPYTLLLCAPNAQPCHQKTGKVTYTYAGPNAHIDIFLARFVKGVKGQWKNEFFTKISLSAGANQAYVFPRRFFAHKGEYRVTLEAFLGTRHSQVVRNTHYFAAH